MSLEFHEVVDRFTQKTWEGHVEEDSLLYNDWYYWVYYIHLDNNDNKYKVCLDKSDFPRSYAYKSPISYESLDEAKIACDKHYKQLNIELLKHTPRTEESMEVYFYKVTNTENWE